MISPFKGKEFKITSIYGHRTLNGARSFHYGLDLVGIDNDIVVAVKDGIVVRSRIVTNKANATWQWGNYVAIQHKDGSIAYYCHLDARYVKQNDKVKAGDPIGLMGDTGYAFGKHLHFELRTITGAHITPCNLLDIPNRVGTYIVDNTMPSINELTAEEYLQHRQYVINKCKIEKQTIAYLDSYKYAKDLWERFYNAMT